MTATTAPLLPLNAGEQYRFVFSMEACVGCHSCEVACAEQNGNPVGVNWRRVGEFEGGTFPDTRRFNLSMACNHCLEPTCLSGCPTNAYIKLDNGIVKHQADECIGCQYCIWNCPYEVPVFNHDRGIVTKCDMCLPRLDAGQSPACVEACPTGAITVERVNVAVWRADHGSADGPSLPASSITLSTTRIVLPETMPDITLAASDQRLRPEDPHWPLIALTLLTQLAVGAVAATLLAELFLTGRGSDVPAAGAVASLAAGGMAMAVSILHLGRPIQAWRALRNVRRSWLSREVALFMVFSGAAFAYTAAWLFDGPTLVCGFLATAFGVAGVYASGKLYLVPARPVWNSPRTLVAFFATAVGTGPLLALLAIGPAALGERSTTVMVTLSALGTIAQLLVYSALIERVASRGEREYRRTARLLFEHFRVLLFVRVASALGACGALAWSALRPDAGGLPASIGLALAFTAAGELIGRYLFYVTVTPMSTAGTFFRR